MGRKPELRHHCPAGYLRHRVNGDWVMVCHIVFEEFQTGGSSHENFEIVPDHCDSYYNCHIWRTEKDKYWKNRVQWRGVENVYGG